MRIGMDFVPDVGENIKENMEVQQNLPNFWQQMQGKYHSFSDTICTHTVILEYFNIKE